MISSTLKRPANPNKNDKWYAYLMISPMMIGFFVFLLLPLLYSFYLSMTNTGVSGTGDFVGLANYTQMLTKDKTFKTVFWNSLYFMAGIVPLSIFSSLLVASLLNRKIKGVGFFRTMVYSPVITSVIVWSVVWKYILAVDYGIVNNFIASLGGERINWFYHKDLTMPTVIVVSMLHGMGNNMVIFLSAMKNVPTEYYEAASIDGATGAKLFFSVTIPLISPTLFLGVVTTCIGGLKVFGTVYALTRGGPANKTMIFVFYIFKLAFKQGKMGYASAVSAVLFALILILTLIQWIMRKRFVYNEI